MIRGILEAALSFAVIYAFAAAINYFMAVRR